jgi:Mn2+/Fe2+ NRAMP family transporter
MEMKKSVGKRLRAAAVFKQLGPGLITGAADDDPSGIATYSQAGAQFGFNMLWTMALTYPLMVAVQLVSARIGRVTGCGLAKNLGDVLPKPLVLTLVASLFIANTINIGKPFSHGCGDPARDWWLRSGLCRVLCSAVPDLADVRFV